MQRILRHISRIDGLCEGARHQTQIARRPLLRSPLDVPRDQLARPKNEPEVETDVRERVRNSGYPFFKPVEIGNHPKFRTLASVPIFPSVQGPSLHHQEGLRRAIQNILTNPFSLLLVRTTQYTFIARSHLRIFFYSLPRATHA